MTNLLIKLFIKDKDVNNLETRENMEYFLVLLEL